MSIDHRAHRDRGPASQDEETTLNARQLDPLTGLLNRQGFKGAVASILAEPDRASSCALALVDLVNFQAVNEVLGRQTGDQVLRESAQRLADVAKPGDLVGRVGGDEFAVLLVDLPAPEMAEPRAGALIGALGVGIKNENSPDSLISSDALCGLAYASEVGTFDDMFRRADEALLVGKLFGRRVTPYTLPSPGGSARTPAPGHDGGSGN